MPSPLEEVCACFSLFLELTPQILHTWLLVTLVSVEMSLPQRRSLISINMSSLLCLMSATISCLNFLYNTYYSLKSMFVSLLSVHHLSLECQLDEGKGFVKFIFGIWIRNRHIVGTQYIFAE